MHAIALTAIINFLHQLSTINAVNRHDNPLLEVIVAVLACDHSKMHLVFDAQICHEYLLPLYCVTDASADCADRKPFYLLQPLC